MRGNSTPLIGDELEVAVARDAGLTRDDLDTVCRDLQEAISLRTGRVTQGDSVSSDNGDEEDEDESISLVDYSPRIIHAGFISYCLGVIFGRWDVRMAKDRRLVPQPQEVLHPITALCCPVHWYRQTGILLVVGRLSAKSGYGPDPDAYHLPDPGAVRNMTIAEYRLPLQHRLGRNPRR